MMLVEQTSTPAAALPVADFRNHLRLGTGFADEGAEDSLLESFLRAAIAAVEAWTGKALLQRDFSLTVAGWRDHAPRVFPLPHPSWRNTGWLKRNPWFQAELLPALRARVKEVLK